MDTQANATPVFISYASADRPTAEAVCAALEAAGIGCWVAWRNVGEGSIYAGEIAKAIRAARVFVLIYSAQTLESPYIVREVDLAIKARAHVIPFRIEDVPPTGDMEFFLQLPQWLDATTAPLAPHLERLTARVQTLLGAAASEPKPFRPSLFADRRLRWLLAGIGFVVLVGGGYMIYRHVQEAAADAAYDEGDAQARQGNYERARKQFDIAIDKDPRFANAYLARGMVTNDGKLAIDDYTKAIELGIDDPKAYALRGRIYGRASQWDLAIPDFSRAIDLSKELNQRSGKTPAISAQELAGYYFDRGTTYNWMQDDSHARSDFAVAAELRGLGQDYWWQGIAARRMGDYAGAIAAQTKAIAKEPMNPNYYGERGLAYLQAGNRGNAERDFQMCHSLDAQLCAVYERDADAIRRGASAAVPGPGDFQSRGFDSGDATSASRTSPPPPPPAYPGTARPGAAR